MFGLDGINPKELLDALATFMANTNKKLKEIQETQSEILKLLKEKERV